MAAETEFQRGLTGLVKAPREGLEIELKSWVDPRDDSGRATIAKALIALANHGGGYLLLGFDNVTATEAQGRPENLGAYSTDAINAAVEKYAEPNFHCDVHLVELPETKRIFPVVVVPAGRVPIRAKKSGPNEAIIQRNSYYIRRPGPKSETPQSGEEWGQLIRRCVTAGRNELLDHFRAIMDPAAIRDVTDEKRISDWAAASVKRWRGRTVDVPQSGAARFPLGYSCVAYQIRGDVEVPGRVELMDALSGAERFTGWPPFWVPTSDETRPYPFDGCIECWLGSPDSNEPAHSDFWRVSEKAEFFLIRGHDEDNPDLAVRGFKPGTIFDITMPIWKIGEIFLHAARMSRRFGSADAEIVFQGEWTGLSGRSLTHVEGRRLLPLYPQRATQGGLTRSVTTTAAEIDQNLPEILQRFLMPLYELFDFFKLPASMVVEELQRLRSRRS